jgi:hypothetical protein
VIRLAVLAGLTWLQRKGDRGRPRG